MKKYAGLQEEVLTQFGLGVSRNKIGQILGIPRTTVQRIILKYQKKIATGKKI